MSYDPTLVIPGSSNMKTQFVNYGQAKYFEGPNRADGTPGIKISEGIISGLTNPILNQDLSNKEYVDSTQNFAYVNTETLINSTEDVLYTPDQILGFIINRNPNGDTRFDTFPTSASVIARLTELGYNNIGTTFKLIINNIANSYSNNSIILDTSDFTIIGISSNIIIYPESSGMFFCTIASEDSIDAYYYNTINKNIGNIYQKLTNGFSLQEPLRTYQQLPTMQVNYNYINQSNNIPLIQNCLFNILGDYQVQINNSFTINSKLPSGSQIIEYLGFTTETIEDLVTFNFTIKLTAFIEHLPLLYTVNILPPDDMTVPINFDTNSIFTLEYSELSWKYASYSIIYSTLSSSFTIYCTSYYDTMTQNF